MNVIHKIHARHTNSGCAKVRETGVGLMCVCSSDIHRTLRAAASVSALFFVCSIMLLAKGDFAIHISIFRHFCYKGVEVVQ